MISFNEWSQLQKWMPLRGNATSRMVKKAARGFKPLLLKLNVHKDLVAFLEHSHIASAEYIRVHLLCSARTSLVIS
jgi:hypothetical protein